MANKPKPSAESHPAYLALQEALAAEPGVDAEVAALEDSLQRFDFIADKVSASHGSNYHQIIRDQQQVVTTLQAKFDVGKADAEDLASAKRELTDAKEALELAPGRRKVLMEELEVAAEAVREAQAALSEATAPWWRNVALARKKLELEAAQMLYAAAEAYQFENPGVFSLGRFAYFLAELPSGYGSFGETGQPQEPLPITRSAVVMKAIDLDRGGERRQDRVVDMMNSMQARQREADLAAGVDRAALVATAQKPFINPSDYQHQVGRQTSQPGPAHVPGIGYSE